MRLIDSKLYNRDLSTVCDYIPLHKMRGKSLLITGGLGLICSTIADILLKYNEVYDTKIDVYIAARSRDAFEKRFGNKKIAFLKYDAMKKFETDMQFDYLICGAGIASPNLYTSMPVETVLSNINGLLELLRYANENEVERLLYISSSEVYGKKETDNPFIEGCYGTVDIDQLRASYPIAKIVSEVLCRSFNSEYKVKTIVVRPGHIYGPSATLKDNRISSLFPRMAAEGCPLKMKSSGIQMRSYCYSVDAAAAILLALLEGTPGESYNIGHDETTSIRTMASLLAKAGNVPLETVESTDEELKAFNPMNNSSLDNKKIKGLGYHDCFSVEEGLKHTVEIIQEIQNT